MTSPLPSLISPTPTDNHGVTTYRAITPSVAEEVAQDMGRALTSSLFETVISNSLQPAEDERVAKLKEEVARLQSELDARREAEFAALKDELKTRDREAQVQELSQELATVRQQLEDTNAKLKQSQHEQQNLRRELDMAQAALKKQPSPTSDLEVENSSLRAQVLGLESQLSGLNDELTQRTASLMVGENSSLRVGSSEETPMLSAAYQQISLLNTQLAHLYTELTMARTEAATLRAEREQMSLEEGSMGLAAASTTTAEANAESQRQAQQIADLISDIRHLQLDLEYHQQKVDQLLQEKQQMLKDLKKSKTDLDQAKRDLEDKQQLLKHQEVDLAHYRQLEQRSQNGTLSCMTSDDGMLDALRSEAAAKDSALIVSHYELHKEKLMRDRLEQKNMKLMERMQKLMMVVETMRKDTVNLERALATRERLCEEREVQLRAVTQKARQLQRSTKADKTRGSGVKKAPVLELESSYQSLPPLDSSRRSDAARNSGLNSGRNTPRTPRGGLSSPYTSR